MIEKINNYRISIKEASRGGIHNHPMVDINDIYGFDTDKYFKHIGQNATRASIDIIIRSMKRVYFVEFKSGKYGNIDNDNINDKIVFTMLKYFGDGDENILKSRDNNHFILVIKDEPERIGLYMEMKSMQSYDKDSEISIEMIQKIMNKYKNFCFKGAEIMTVSRFTQKMESVRFNECFKD